MHHIDISHYDSFWHPPTMTVQRLWNLNRSRDQFPSNIIFSWFPFQSTWILRLFPKAKQSQQTLLVNRKKKAPPNSRPRTSWDLERFRAHLRNCCVSPYSFKCLKCFTVLPEAAFVVAISFKMKFGDFLEIFGDFVSKLFWNTELTQERTDSVVGE